MLNPQLFAVLAKNFGDVRVTSEGIKRVEDRAPGRRPVVKERGEHYMVCCPLCGDDRYRLSISYLWLTKPPLSGRRRSELAHCYNEDCKVTAPEFYNDLLQDLHAAELGLLQEEVDKAKKRGSAGPRKRVAIRLPKGLVPLHELRKDHPALQFLCKNYPAFGKAGSDVIAQYLGTQYGAAFAEMLDDLYPLVRGRVVFPIYNDGALVGWQGRAIDATVEPRWLLPPGFLKTFYNGDRVAPHETPVISEGITNAICSGPRGVAIFGKELNTIRAEEFGKRWKSAIIATDPDTFVPDNRKGGRGRIFAYELRDLLVKHVPRVRMIAWPKEVLEAATVNNNGTKTKVPDAADLGFAVMHKLIDAADHA
jgi:hypothetical protein